MMFILLSIQISVYTVVFQAYVPDPGCGAATCKSGWSDFSLSVSFTSRSVQMMVCWWADEAAGYFLNAASVFTALVCLIRAMQEWRAGMRTPRLIAPQHSQTLTLRPPPSPLARACTSSSLTQLPRVFMGKIPI